VITDACDADAPADFHARLDAVMPHLAQVIVAWLEARCGLAGTSSRSAPGL